MSNTLITEHQPHMVIACDDGHQHVIALSTLRRFAGGLLPAENLPECLVRAIARVLVALLDSRRDNENDAWVRLGDLPPGFVFATQTCVLAVKTEYYHINGQCKCVLLGSGEYASFAQGNDTMVVALEIAQPEQVAVPEPDWSKAPEEAPRG